jgi:argininosuccinate lyase
MSVHKENMESACKVGHLSATDLADYLVQHCDIPFREAHFITGKAVAKSEALGIDLSDIPFAELKAIDARIKENVMPFLSIKHSMNARTSEGGTAAVRTMEQLAHLNTWLEANQQ